MSLHRLSKHLNKVYILNWIKLDMMQVAALRPESSLSDVLAANRKNIRDIYGCWRKEERIGCVKIYITESCTNICDIMWQNYSAPSTVAEMLLALSRHSPSFRDACRSLFWSAKLFNHTRLGGGARWKPFSKYWHFKRNLYHEIDKILLLQTLSKCGCTTMHFSQDIKSSSVLCTLLFILLLSKLQSRFLLSHQKVSAQNDGLSQSPFQANIFLLQSQRSENKHSDFIKL